MRDDLYAVLGLEPRASSEALDRAYRFCMELYGEGALATYSLLDPAELDEQRARVQRAYAVLSDPDERRAYDEANGFLPPEEPAPLLAPKAAAPRLELPSEVTGPSLRRIREARGLTLPHIAAVTKVGVRFLEYIEGDRFEMLPPPVYLRGFLQEYARLVGVEPRSLAEAYLRRLPRKA